MGSSVTSPTGNSPAGASVASGDLPRRFGKYLLFDHIGRGGMADIYLALEHGSLMERRVVLKLILPTLSSDPGFSSMLAREAKLAAQLSHANIVSTLELGREEEQLYIVMDYVEGFDLNQLLRRLSKGRVPLPAEFAFLIVRDVLTALDYAHRARSQVGVKLNVVHRDVSPSNVLISIEGEVQLCDFGIARAYGEEQDEDLVEKARVAGKSAYMSPEQARGEILDGRSDLYTAGILLWELAAGRRMVRGSEDEMLAKARLGAQLPLPDRGLPEEEALREILGRALAVNRDERFQTAAEFLEALTEYLSNVGLMASQLRFASFLRDHFGEDLLLERRARERAAKADTSPVDQESAVRPIDRKPSPLPSVPEVMKTPSTPPATEPLVAPPVEDAEAVAPKPRTSSVPPRRSRPSGEAARQVGSIPPGVVAPAAQGGSSLKTVSLFVLLAALALGAGIAFWFV